MIVTERIGVSDRGAFVAMGLAFALVLAGVLAMLWRSEQGRSDRPLVGADLHATFISEGRLFVSGHDGAAVSDHRGEWKQIEDLASADAMAWASTPKGLLVAGHTGIYETAARRSRSWRTWGSGRTRDGRGGFNVYVSTPDRGLFVSNDGGVSFATRGSMPGLMGTIQVNSENSDQALGADMEAGVVRTSDGGRTWESLGNGFRATSVAQNPRIPAELVAIGASEAAVSRDGGSTWEPLDVPEGTAAATYDSVGELVVAALVRDEAVTYRLRAGKWYPA